MGDSDASYSPMISVLLSLALLLEIVLGISAGFALGGFLSQWFEPREEREYKHQPVVDDRIIPV